MGKNRIIYTEDQWIIERQKLGDKKFCSLCRQFLPLDFFRESKWFKTGLVSNCHDCEKLKNKEFRKNNLEKCKKRCNDWRLKNINKARQACEQWHRENKEYHKDWSKENIEKIKLSNKKYNATKKAKNRTKKHRESEKYKNTRVNYYEKNREKLLEYSKDWVFKNKDRKAMTSRNWYENNKDRVDQIRKRFLDQNPNYSKYQAAKRRALIANATPNWVDMEEIKKIYQNCPPGYHVDHIMPLNHPLLCGLHVPWNLQYLPAKENLRKSNKLLNIEKHGLPR